MKNFTRDSKPAMKRSGGKSFGKSSGRPSSGRPSSGRPSFGGSDRTFVKRSSDRKSSDDRQMFTAICSNCGINCGVPFKPTENRPVLCKSCFKKQEGADFGNTYEKPSYQSKSYEKPSFQANRIETVRLETLNAKLDKILELLTPSISLANNFGAELELDEAEAPKAPAKRIKK